MVAFRSLLALTTLTLSTGVFALYSSGDGVTQLTDSSFDKSIKGGAGLTLVEFYAPWCGHCKNLAPEWKKAAKALKGLVTVAAIDCDANKAVAGKFQISGFPTIKLFIEGKSEPISYDGAREAPAIVSWAMGQASSLAKTRLSGKASSSSGSKGGSSKGSSSGGGSKGSSGGNNNHDGPGGGKHVVELTPDNFDSLVLGSSEPWFVEFYAPWCGHCKSLAPEWAGAAEAMADGGVKFGAVDADKHRELGQRFSVKGFPTIKTFAAGSSSDSAAVDYNGPRTKDGLVSAASAMASANPSGGSGKVHEITGKEAWTEVCSGKVICVAAVLPHILDDATAKRTARLGVLAEAAGKARGKPIRIVWWEVGSHPVLEDALGVGMVPQVFAIAESKGIATPHKGALELSSLSAFITGLTSTKGASGAARFPKDFNLGASLKNVPAWDGKDGVAFVDEPLDAEEGCSGGGAEGLCTRPDGEL